MRGARFVEKWALRLLVLIVAYVEVAAFTHELVVEQIQLFRNKPAYGVGKLWSRVQQICNVTIIHPRKLLKIVDTHLMPR